MYVLIKKNGKKTSIYKVWKKNIIYCNYSYISIQFLLTLNKFLKSILEKKYEK